MNMEQVLDLLQTNDGRVVVIVNSTVIIGNDGDIVATNETSPGT